MSELRIATNPTFDTVVTVRESDKYSKQVYIKLEQPVAGLELSPKTELFMTPAQLLQLGQFLIEQSKSLTRVQQELDL